MAWTTPTTWANGNRPTGAQLVTNIKDNMDWLKSRTQGNALAGSPTTSAPGITAVTGTSVTLTTYGGRMLLIASGAVSCSSAAATITIGFFQDSATISGSGVNFGQTVANHYIPFSVWFITTAAPSAGSHTFEMAWTAFGSALTGAPNTLRLHVIELF